VTDQELIGYLDRRFGEISQLRDDVRTLRAETTQKFDELREENRQTRTALEEQIQQTRAALEGEIQQTRAALEEENRQTRAALEEGDRQTRAALEEENRQTRAALEEGDRQTRVVVEDLRSELQLVAEGVVGLGERLEVHKNDVLQKFDEVKASIAPYYLDLNRRVKVLEDRADRQTRDVIDVIRERYAKR
jgi:hypothetical protein